MGSILETTAAVAPGDDGARKARILAALTAYARQRPGFDPRNYGTASSYNADRRRALRQLHDVERMASAVAWRSIGPDDLVQAARGGRVTITERDETFHVMPGTVCVDYCAGQYFPTEFRGAIARVLASAVWDWTREHAMPAPVAWRVRYPDGTESAPMQLHAAHSTAAAVKGAYTVDLYRDGKGRARMHAADWLRAYFVREFGRHLARRYFN